jgi:hypothetical protein
MRPTLSIAELEALTRDVSRTDTNWQWHRELHRKRLMEEDSENYLRRREPLPKTTGVAW